MGVVAAYKRYPNMKPINDQQSAGAQDDSKTIARMAASTTPQAYFECRYQRYIQNPNRISWNGWAFLARSAWLFYHKMYRELGWFSIIFGLFSLMPAVVDGCINLILYVSLGLYGNVLLFESLEGKLKDGFKYLFNYQYTHTLGLSVLFYFLPMILCCLLGLILRSSTTMSIEEIVAILAICYGFFHIAIGLAALFFYKWEKRQAQQASNWG